MSNPNQKQSHQQQQQRRPEPAPSNKRDEDEVVIEPKAVEPTPVVEPVAEKVEAEVVVVAPTVTQAPASAASRELPSNVEGKEVTDNDRWIQQRLSDNQFRSYVRLNSSGKIAIAGVMLYIEAMNPKLPMSAKDGIRHQFSLYRNVVSLLNNADNTFQVALGLLLSIANDHKENGVFALQNILRFTEGLTIRNSDRRLFNNLFTMIFQAADPKSRKAVMHNLDLARALFGKSNEPTELSNQAKDQIIAFFQG